LKYNIAQNQGKFSIFYAQNQGKNKPDFAQNQGELQDFPII